MFPEGIIAMEIGGCLEESFAVFLKIKTKCLTNHPFYYGIAKNETSSCLEVNLFIQFVRT